MATDACPDLIEPSLVETLSWNSVGTVRHCIGAKRGELVDVGLRADMSGCGYQNNTSLDRRYQPHEQPLNVVAGDSTVPKTHTSLETSLINILADGWIVSSNRPPQAPAARFGVDEGSLAPLRCSSAKFSCEDASI